MSDKTALNDAETIVEHFWREFDEALSPKNASKRAYLEALEALDDDVASRIACVRDEIQSENE